MGQVGASPAEADLRRKTGRPPQMSVTVICAAAPSTATMAVPSLPACLMRRRMSAGCPEASNARAASQTGSHDLHSNRPSCRAEKRLVRPAIDARMTSALAVGARFVYLIDTMCSSGTSPPVDAGVD
jgi:hypothetical protein